MPFRKFRPGRLHFVFLLYWILLAYIFAALIWWGIALANQNRQMTALMRAELVAGQPDYAQKLANIDLLEKRKQAQYLGEGIIFFLLISAGAVFVHRAVRKQISDSQQQQHFMMAITHELKTPIAVTKLNLETLQRRKLDEQQQHKLISNTIYEANRLNALCNNLLLSSQIESGGYQLTTEAISFSDLVDNSAGEYQGRFPQRRFIISIEPELETEGDSLLLQLAVNNLLENAVKYTAKDKTVSITLKQQQGMLILEVADEGKGIPPTEFKKVFEKYYRVGNAATKAAKGTGLGLYLTKKIILQHQGRIGIRENHPNGCIFHIHLKARGNG